MMQPTPRSTLTDTLFPFLTLIRSQILDRGSVLLCDAVQLGDGLNDRFQAAGLLYRGGGYFAHDVGDAAYRLDDFLHGLAGAGGVVGTDRHAIDGLVDQGLDFFRGR